MNKFICAVCLCLLFFAGCHATEELPSETTSKAHPFAEQPLIIGLIPEQNIFKQLERYQPLADYLSKKIGRKIELKILTRYGNIVDNFIDLKMDGAFFGSFTYALAHEKIGVQVLARPENFEGVSTYHGFIFFRKDSGIQTVQDMKGKRFVFVDKTTTAGFLLPMVFFKVSGIRDYKSYLQESYFAGTHEDAIYDVLKGKADIGAAKNTVFARLVKIDPAIRDQLVILTKSPEVPENGLAVRKGLDETLKIKLKESLLNMHNDPDGVSILINFGARKFIETTDHDYESISIYAKTIGLDLATYDYSNE